METQKKNKIFGNSPIRMHFIQDYNSAIVKMFNNPHMLLSDDISLLKGMCNRCVKHDQGDWRTTFYAIGRPDLSILKEFVKESVDLRDAIREKNYGGVVAFREKYKDILQNMVEYSGKQLDRVDATAKNKTLFNENMTAKKTKKSVGTKRVNSSDGLEIKNERVNNLIDVDFNNVTYLISMYLFNAYVSNSCSKDMDIVLCKIFDISSKTGDDRLRNAFDIFFEYRNNITELCNKIYQDGMVDFSYEINEKMDFDVIEFEDLYFYFLRVNNVRKNYVYMAGGDKTGKKKCNQLLKELPLFEFLSNKFIYSFDTFYYGLTKTYDTDFVKDNLCSYDYQKMDICDCFGTKLFTDLLVKDFQSVVEHNLRKQLENKPKRYWWQAKNLDQTHTEEPLEIIAKIDEYGCFSVYEALVKHSLIDYNICFSEEYNEEKRYQKIDEYIFVTDLIKQEIKKNLPSNALIHFYNTYQVYRKIMLYTANENVASLVKEVYEQGNIISEKTSLNKKKRYVVIEREKVYYCYLINYVYQSVILVNAVYDDTNLNGLIEDIAFANNIQGKTINGFQIANTKEIFLNNREHMWKRISNDLLRNWQVIPGSYITNDYPFLCYAYMICGNNIVVFPKNSFTDKKDYRGDEDLDNEFDTQKLLDTYWEHSYHSYFGDYDDNYDYEISQGYDDYY